MLISAFFLLHIETFKFQIFHDSFPVNKFQTGSEARTSWTSMWHCADDLY